jgi:hypothetical protein
MAKTCQRKVGKNMTVMYKERLSDVFEVVVDTLSGYYEVRKNSVLVSAVQGLIEAIAVFNSL